MPVVPAADETCCRNPSPELPDGWFNWIRPFFAIKDDYIINNCSLDGFFFLRFLRVLSIICLAGCCFIWPILLPIHSTGGSGLVQLDGLTIGNIALPDKFYAHVVVAWCFFGWLTPTTTKEAVLIFSQVSCCSWCVESASTT